MRALTVRQPFAELIVAGVKPVENRPWPVPSTLYGCPECDGAGCDEPATACAGAYVACDYCGGFPRDVDPFPLRIGIHAAKTDADYPTIPWAAWDALAEATGGAIPPRGKLVGFVSVVGGHHADDCAEDDTLDFPLHIGSTPANSVWRKRYCSRWAEPDAYHWLLADPQRCDPVPMRGRQGLWHLDAEGLVTR